MSEVLGDAEAHDGSFLDDYDGGVENNALDDEVGRRPFITDLLDTIGSPAALALTALVLSVFSLVGLLSSYLLASALTVSHNTNSGPLFGERVNAGVQLGVGVLGAILALVAHWASVRAEDVDDSLAQRGPRAMAGAALLLSAISIVQSVAALIIMVGAKTSGQ